MPNELHYPEKRLRLSASGVGAWRMCPQYWSWNYEANLVQKTSSRPLQVGSLTHVLIHKYYMNELNLEDFQDLTALVQKIYPGNDKNMSIDVAVETGRLVLGYLTQYQKDPLTIISSEMQLSVIRKEPITGYEYEVYGIVDAVCRTPDNRLWRLEHKTTAQMDSIYLGGLRQGLQGGIYHYLLNELMPEPIVGTIYNLLVKTKIPQYSRAPVLMQDRIAQRALSTFDGVVREILRHDIYQDAGACYSWYECPYLPLCNRDTPETREAFYRPKEVQKPADAGSTLQPK